MQPRHSAYHAAAQAGDHDRPPNTPLTLAELRGDIADAARVIAWANEQPRRPASVAFTAGPERQAAYWIEWAESRTVMPSWRRADARYASQRATDDAPHRGLGPC